VGQTIAYRLGIRPTTDYKPAARLRMTRFQLMAAANRTVGYALTGFLSSVVAGQRNNAIAVGLETGILIGIVTAISGWFTPLIEWIADHAPEKRLGVFGIALMLIGFTFQSAQYWVAFLDIRVR
jgi:hypothetical protein